jgi:hypothetical protein
MFNLSSLLLGLVDKPVHVFSTSLWLSIFVTMIASLSGLNPAGRLVSTEPRGSPLCPLDLFLRDPDGPGKPDG